MKSGREPGFLAANETPSGASVSVSIKMNMYRIALILATAVLTALGQEAIKIAPEKEAELKARVSKFWDGFVNAKYRSSDAYVSDEAKEDFFSWPKKKIKGYSIERISYTEGGKYAKVLTYVDTNLAMMGVGSMDIKQPVETWWREEETGWFWFQPKNEIRDTPFGKMESNPKSGEAPVGIANSVHAVPDVKALMSSVKPDKQDIQFVTGVPGSDVVTISNGLPGIVTLTIDVPPAEDITFELSSKTIPRGGTATLTVKYAATYKPADPKAAILKVVRVGVAQTGMMYPVRVRVKANE